MNIYFIMISSLFMIIISNLVMKISILISKKMKLNFEKMTPFECGFEPSTINRMPFSINFFLIAIIFLIFDIEIALLLPMILTMKLSNLTIWSMSSIIFLMILTLGLWHEWKQGALNWL